MKKLPLVIAILLLFRFSYAADFYSADTARDQVRMLLQENTRNFITDTKIDNWIKEAVEDISTRALCIQQSDTFLLVTSQYEYTDFVTGGAAASADVVKVWGCFYVSTTDEYIGLERIEPAELSTLRHMKAGPPKYFYHFADKIGILPLPTSAENGNSVRIYYAIQSQDITDLPNEYQPLTFLYTVVRACEQKGLLDKAKLLYVEYENRLNSLRSDLYNVVPDPKNQ